MRFGADNACGDEQEATEKTEVLLSGANLNFPHPTMMTPLAGLIILLFVAAWSAKHGDAPTRNEDTLGN